MQVSYRLYANGKLVNRFSTSNLIYELIKLYESKKISCELYLDIQSSTELVSCLIYDTQEPFALLKGQKIKLKRSK